MTFLTGKQLKVSSGARWHIISSDISETQMSTAYWSGASPSDGSPCFCREINDSPGRSLLQGLCGGRPWSGHLLREIIPPLPQQGGNGMAHRDTGTHVHAALHHWVTERMSGDSSWSSTNRNHKHSHVQLSKTPIKKNMFKASSWRSNHCVAQSNSGKL